MFKKWQGLALFWLLFGIANLFRAGTAYRLIETLTAYPLAAPLPALIGFYTMWGAAFLFGAAWTWQRRMARRALPLALSYQAALWALRLSAYRADYARHLWGRDALLSGLFVLVVVWLAHEKQPQQTEWMGTDGR
ncbi:MAG TPA: hypothetical protein PKH77_25135 [Anaerolineae bacterium]|nr:hypothetical protein [Anaerolineae bacterium]